MPDPLPSTIDDYLGARRTALRSVLGVALDAVPQQPFDCLLLASDFAQQVLLTQPDAVALLVDGPPPAPPTLDPLQPGDWPSQLRRWRAQSSFRLIWRDVTGLDSVEDTLAGVSALADSALQIALDAVQAQVAGTHGVIRSENGAPQSLVVFALGKLGGGELNFSSDVDLVFAYEHQGSSDGARPLEAEAWYARVGQRLIALLNETTHDGFCHRVDMRLRPFGKTGRLALSFAAMEQYYQNEGRDWERYAWVKARAAAGDIAAGERLLRTLRPFVYRRYLDYTALDGLREMKAMIAAEVERRELADDLKLGPGGIREIEFLAQTLQLIRGGREPALRQRALLPALVALSEAGHLQVDTAHRLADAYRFLRRLENRVQMFADLQLHSLPEDPFARTRFALALGYADWSLLQSELDAHRALVAQEFQRLLALEKRVPAPSDLTDYWRGLANETGTPAMAAALADSGFAHVDSAHAALRDFARGASVRGISQRARARLDRLLPKLLQSAAATPSPDIALPRLLALVQSIVRRSSYLALLDEQPGALQRLVEICASSALLAERVAAHPLLLDEMLDTGVDAVVATRESLALERERALVVAGDDAEAQLHALAEYRQGIAFRIGLALLNQRVDAVHTARQLAWLAEAVLIGVLQIARTEQARRSGVAMDAADGFAVIGYGSLGGEELGFGSDLDLVFLHDSAHPDREAIRHHAKLAQRLVSLLGTLTPAGRLYEVDVRLRPDGAKGLLVSSVAAFDDYQRSRAWTWERQALVRAHGICGDHATLAAFESIRADVLAQPRDVELLLADVIAMRARMRAELDRSRADGFDLKQGAGGLVDLEFLLQFLVLANAPQHPSLRTPRASAELIDTLADCGVLSSEAAKSLAAAHSDLLHRSLACTLDTRPRVVQVDAAIQVARNAIRDACRAHGLADAAAASDC